MRSFACRRLGSLGLTFRSGPANTAIAQTTITRADHGGERSHAPRFLPGAAASDGRTRVSCRRPETMAYRGLEGENVIACIKLTGVATPRLFAEPGICVEAVCAADGVGRKNRAGVSEDQLAISNARNDTALTHDKVCSVIASAACVDARVAVAARVSDRSSDPARSQLSRGPTRFASSRASKARAKRIGVAAVAMRAGGEARAARHLAVAAVLRPRSHRRKPSRRLKPLATSLEAMTGGAPAPGSATVEANPVRRRPQALKAGHSAAASRIMVAG
jgi:hypothetical protein